MGTYGDMQQRIADELGSRTDLLQVTSGLSTALPPILAAIQTAIAKWAATKFYFNEIREANIFNTAQGQEFYGDDTTPISNALIATMAHFDKVTVEVTGNRYTLNPRTYQYLEDISVNPIVYGQPVDYAYYGEQLRLYPIPDGSYPITLSGIYNLTPLVLTTDSNAWTNDAEALIRCTAKEDIYTNVLRNPDMADKMSVQIYGDLRFPGKPGYLYDLKAQGTRRIAQSGRIRPTYF